MIAAWYRRGGAGWPPDAESLSVEDDGTFHLWRSVGATAAGRFSGTLAPDRIEPLREAATAAESTGDLTLPTLPDAGVETAVTLDRRADFSSGVDVDGPWKPLVVELRRMADEFVRCPSAAVGLAVGDGGLACRLVHLGGEEVLVDLGSLRLRADVWDGWYVPAGSWVAPLPVVTGGGRVSATPGWSIELPFDHGLDLGPGRTLHAAADLQLVVAGNELAAGLRHAPVPDARP